MSKELLLTIIIIAISAFVVIVPIAYTLILPFCKKLNNQKNIRYLYAFTAGFFMILATVGFISESKEELHHFFLTNVSKNEAVIGVILASIIGGVIFIGLSCALLLKYLFAKKIEKNNKTNEIHQGHDHDHMIFNLNDVNPKSKSLAIFFMLSHRIPGGLILGLLSASIARNGGQIDITSIMFLISFLIHIIPEELIIYFRQIEMGISKWKAAGYSIAGISIIIPFIIIGALIGWYLEENVYVVFVQIINLLAASFLIFTSIVEFFPEFMHNSIKGKTWYITIFMFILGIVFAIIILSFHTHV